MCALGWMFLLVLLLLGTGFSSAVQDCVNASFHPLATSLQGGVRRYAQGGPQTRDIILPSGVCVERDVVGNSSFLRSAIYTCTATGRNLVYEEYNVSDCNSDVPIATGNVSVPFNRGGVKFDCQCEDAEYYAEMKIFADEKSCNVKEDNASYSYLTQLSQLSDTCHGYWFGSGSPSSAPSAEPSVSLSPNTSPTTLPTSAPSVVPTTTDSTTPTQVPSQTPTPAPTKAAFLGGSDWSLVMKCAPDLRTVTVVEYVNTLQCNESIKDSDGREVLNQAFETGACTSFDAFDGSAASGRAPTVVKFTCSRISGGGGDRGDGDAVSLSESDFQFLAIAFAYLIFVVTTVGICICKRSGTCCFAKKMTVDIVEVKGGGAETPKTTETSAEGATYNEATTAEAVTAAAAAVSCSEEHSPYTATSFAEGPELAAPTMVTPAAEDADFAPPAQSEYGVEDLSTAQTDEVHADEVAVSAEALDAGGEGEGGGGGGGGGGGDAAENLVDGGKGAQAEDEAILQTVVTVGDAEASSIKDNVKTSMKGEVERSAEEM